MNKLYFRSLIMLVCFVICTLNLTAQKAELKITDKETSEPCPYANVVLYDMNNKYLKGDVADRSGHIAFDINGKTKFEVSLIGYLKHTGYISPGENKTVKLEIDYVGMEEVVVTGQYEPKKLDQSIYKIDVINSRTLNQRGVTNLAEALSNQPEIRLSVDPSTGTSVILQGMGGENVKYLINGIPIIGRVNGDIDLAQINIENIDHIEIVQGPMSVIYGTSALAGVINIITKQNLKSKNIFKANSFINNKNTYNFGFYGSVIRGKHTISLSGNRDMFQGIDINLDPDTLDYMELAYGEGKDRYMEFKPKRVLNADLEYNYRKKFFQLGVKTQYMDLLLKNYLNPTPIGIAYDADLYTARSTNSIIISNKFNNGFSFNIIGAYTYFERNTYRISSNLKSLEKTVTDTSSTNFQNLMTRGNFTYLKENFPVAFQFGWDLNHDKGEGDKIVDGAEMGDYAGYISAVYTPFKQLSFQPGLRYIYNSIYDAPLIPSLNLQLSILKGLNFRISYAKGFRAPSLKELYLDFKDSNHNLEGNTDLKAEKSDSYNASIVYKIGLKKHLFKIEPNVFYNDGKDVIEIVLTDAATNSARNENVGNRRTIGGGVNISYWLANGWFIGGAYNKTGITYSDYETGEFDPYVLYDNYTVNFKYEWRKYKTVFMVNLKYYGETPHNAYDTDTEEYYLVYTKPYGDLEATISKQLWKNRITVVLGGKNLLNVYSSNTYGYRGDTYEYNSPKNYGQTFFLKLNFSINN